MTPRVDESKLPKLTKNQKYELAKKEAGLKKVTVWCPDYAVDELKELMGDICDFHNEKGEFHKKLFPSMYREFSTGRVGNKSLRDVKLTARKATKVVK